MSYSSHAVSVLLLIVLACDAQEQTCVTQENTRGICIDIRRCDPLVNLLRSRSNDPSVVNYLRRTLCRITESATLVCCPVSDRIVSPDNIIPPTSPPPTTTTIAEGALDVVLKPPECGFSNITSLRIVGGVPAKLGEFPWIAALGYRNSKNPDLPKWLCGGSLISKKHVLTAGHCVHNRNDLYVVKLGDLDLYDDNDGAVPVTVPIAKVRLHEDYNPTLHTNDVAVVTLEYEPKAPLVWPICLPVDEPLRSNKFVKYYPFVAGWGALQFRGPTSSLLQTTILPVVENEKCSQAFANFRTVIDDSIICAGYPQGGKDTCQGDSGGPLMYGKAEENNVRFYQIGVVSYGFRCAEAGYPGVYSRVTAFVDWIARNLN